ncbi:MAG: DUF4954 family protein, partial [Planctomycetes bacterium]|nr:DUF4954 family protein [Planctomycetota bacterium]
MICDRLSAQLAYVMALYRDRTELIEKIRMIIADYAESVRSSRGTVGEGAKVARCRTLINVKIGPHAVLQGVSKLENGTVNSSQDAPSFVGTDVIASDFILSAGATLDTAANITRCFVGAGAEIAAGFTAADSLFFANSVMHGGEAVSVFAGPFTVSHHKSSLLIAAMYSFFNAGSGLSHSNHMYKLGPVHQGIVERGAKTASDAYMLWPARVGAFSFVKGRHYASFDTSAMPFSYILEGADASVLVPAVNLRNVGTTRDSQKWPTRDKRKDKGKLDAITFPMLTPYTASRIIAALDTLKKLKDSADDVQYDYNGTVIDRSAIDHGIRLYQMAIDRYVGGTVASRLAGRNIESIQDLAALFENPTELGKGNWIDAAGPIAPQQAIDALLTNIENGTLQTVDSINEAFTDILDSFDHFEWSWTLNFIEDKLRDNEADFSLDFVIDLVSGWSESAEKLDTMRLADAEREFDEPMQTGYGIDGEKTGKKADFKAVRTTPDQNNFIQKLKQNQTKNKKQAINLLEKLKNIT